MEEKIDNLIQAVHAFKAKEVLVPVSSDEFLEITNALSVSSFVRTNVESKAISGIGGNIVSYRKYGITVHFKIDTNLSNV